MTTTLTVKANSALIPSNGTAGLVDKKKVQKSEVVTTTFLEKLSKRSDVVKYNECIEARAERVSRLKEKLTHVVNLDSQSGVSKLQSRLDLMTKVKFVAMVVFGVLAIAFGIAAATTPLVLPMIILVAAFGMAAFVSGAGFFMTPTKLLTELNGLIQTQKDAELTKLAEDVLGHISEDLEGDIEEAVNQRVQPLVREVKVKDGVIKGLQSEISRLSSPKSVNQEEWYYMNPSTDGHIGPLTRDQMQNLVDQRRLDDNVKVWSSGSETTEWRDLGDILVEVPAK